MRSEILEKLAESFGYKSISLKGWDSTLEDIQSWLESKGVYIGIVPELYQDGINWNWSLVWYLDKKDWQYSNVDDKDVLTRVAGGTSWYGDNGEYLSRDAALEAALILGIKKLDPLFRNNSSEKLAALYGITQNELLGKIRGFSDQLGEWSFKGFTREQLDIIVKHLGDPLK